MSIVQEKKYLIEKWYRKGQESIMRTNRSGCCCEIDENDNIISLCQLHRENNRQVLLNFIQKMEKNSEDLDPDIASAVSNNFWDLI